MQWVCLTLALKRDVISIILNSTHTCPLLQREAFCLFSKAVYYTSILERTVQNKGSQCLCPQNMWKCKRPLENYLQHNVSAVSIPPWTLGKFFQSIPLYQPSWLIWRTKEGPSLFNLSYACVTQDWYYKQDSSSKMRPTYNIDLHQVLQGPGLNQLNKSHKPSGSTLKIRTTFSFMCLKWSFHLDH